ncbi:YebC/PmpR family DNA-binding transcriptional regulator [Chromohalobacter sp. TMW 2.2308]|uniref:Probable transcriptional regulatory protein KZO87_14225 n=1 Tax=Chromohalobacter moromii TaxID=2860329 RepID=A0A9X2X4E5_9GAMM|nr:MULTISPECIES: YebC/PmpR family DNA-binding transcriptional regulator [Chromohalobacter]CDQ36121.1 Transcriptional regulatory protein PmpR [Virgibacillus halodenitrificans]MCK2044120.1 YebC/PmpR family DNA-binding transcriptional regulator [Chromohalobacter moromii]MCK2046953.1 YebC/PmpR family DNA-binding transcriptional regulator [Chromohalobacter moromii]MCT8506530.1 YebC/PmpR family DNA-binding transcriptional regulator [Chromohalobacter moromii]MCT8515755.1 YebC/PmpR family DNA-binding 
MAGHSKWANIKHRKAAQDAKRGKIFSKLIRELTVASRQGGGEVADNPRLRAAIDKALANNMTKDTIQRAIERGAGNTDGDEMEETIYEGYGPEGVAVMVECMTDNRNRTVSEVRHAFNKNGGNLGTSGSVAFMFHKQGRLTLPEGTSEEAAMEATLAAEPDDIITQDDGTLEIVTSVEGFGEVKDALIEAGIEPSASDVGSYPDNYSPIDDTDTARKVLKLFDMLEDLDDVQNVYSNADFSDAVMAELE